MNIDFLIKNHLKDFNKPISDFILIKEYSDNNKYTDEETMAFLDNYCKGDYPIQYLVGYEYFFDKKVFVNEDVLIPRMETEEVVLEFVKNIKENYTPEDKLKILDLCTGSGAITIGINKYLKEYNIEYYASDISKEALKVAAANFQYHNIDVNVVESDLFENMSGLKFDGIISNPPYISKNGIVDDNVAKYEPNIALFANNDGLEIYERILDEVNNHLKEKSLLCFEIGYDQGQKIQNILINQKVFTKFDIIKDMNSKDRIFLAVKGLI